MSTEQKSFEELAPPILESLGWELSENKKSWVSGYRTHEILGGRCNGVKLNIAVALSAWEIRQAVLVKCRAEGWQLTLSLSSEYRGDVFYWAWCEPELMVGVIESSKDEPPYTALLRAYTTLCMGDKP